MKKPLLTIKDIRSILAMIVFVVVLAVGLLGVNWWLAKQYGTGTDFLPVWNGARAFIFEQSYDPYSRTIAEQTQLEVYGRAAQEGEFPYALDVPFPLLLLYFAPLYIVRIFQLFFPSLAVPDPIWARAAWMIVSEFGLLFLATFALRLADWRPNRWFAFLLLAFSLTWYYSVIAIAEGTFSILLTLALIGALAALRDFHDEFAGFLLVFASMRWEVTILLWLFIVVGAISARRWRLFSGMAMTWFVLGAVAFLLYPDWIWPYLRAVTANLRADVVLTPAIILNRWIPVYGTRLTHVVVSFLLLLLVFEWFSAYRSKDIRRVAWTAALTLAITPLLGFSTTLANLAPLVFSFVLILPFAWERWEKHTYLRLSLLVVLFFAFPFVLRWPGIAATPPLGLVFLLPSVLIIVGLYWIRWYVVRPPRTWLDGVKREIRK